VCPGSAITTCSRRPESKGHCFQKSGGGSGFGDDEARLPIACGMLVWNPPAVPAPALGIARNTITLWTGPDGDGKTYLSQVMALAVSRGDMFLGMPCKQAPVLYVDLENPGYVVQNRMQILIEDGNSLDGLRFWGTWLEIDQQPPHAGSELLLTICKETQPLLIVDPFRYFHTAEENDSTAMAGIMQYLRACAAYGCAVVILHHPAKAEGSTGRGSSAICGACDLALLHTHSTEKLA
jgi:RecA-family ATPase